MGFFWEVGVSNWARPLGEKWHALLFLFMVNSGHGLPSEKNAPFKFQRIKEKNPVIKNKDCTHQCSGSWWILSINNDVFLTTDPF